MRHQPFDSFSGRGGWWVIVQNALTLAVLVLGVLFQGSPGWGAGAAAGVPFLAVGAWLGFAGVRALGTNLTPFPKPKTDSRLIQSGVYGLVRHPLYSCLMFLAVGWALLWQSGAALGAAGALALCLNAKARIEERWLRQRHAEYDSYAQRVRRFVPGMY